MRDAVGACEADEMLQHSCKAGAGRLAEQLSQSGSCDSRQGYLGGEEATVSAALAVPEGYEGWPGGVRSDGTGKAELHGRDETA